MGPKIDTVKQRGTSRIARTSTLAVMQIGWNFSFSYTTC